MKQSLVLLLAMALCAIAAVAGSDPLVGTWRLDSQEVNGQKIDSEPLTLRVTQEGDKLAFAFSVPVNHVYFVSMSYIVKLDGSEADVKNANGQKIGTVQITAARPSQYKLTLKGQNRPESSGTLVISSDGKTLTSEQNTTQAGPSARSMHSKQVFSRY